MSTVFYESSTKVSERGSVTIKSEIKKVSSNGVLEGKLHFTFTMDQQDMSPYLLAHKSSPMAVSIFNLLARSEDVEVTNALLSIFKLEYEDAENSIMSEENGVLLNTIYFYLDLSLLGLSAEDIIIRR